MKNLNFEEKNNNNISLRGHTYIGCLSAQSETGVSKVFVCQKLIIIGSFEPVMMRNFSDPISKPLFQLACLYNLLFVNSLSYTTDSKIDEFKIMNSKV